MRCFRYLWQGIKDCRATNDPETPKVSKVLTIIRWTDAFRDHLHQCVGVRHIPLGYVTQTDNAVAMMCSVFAYDQPYSSEHTSIEGDLIARSSHAHGLFHDNNANV